MRERLMNEIVLLKKQIKHLNEMNEVLEDKVISLQKELAESKQEKDYIRKGIYPMSYSFYGSTLPELIVTGTERE